MYRDAIGEAGQLKDDKYDAKLHKIQMRSAVLSLAASSEGMYFLRWLVNESGALAASYPTDNLRMAFQEGKRSIGVKIFAHIVDAGCAGEFFMEDVNHG